MQVAYTGAAPQLAAMLKTPEKSEGPGPDHDGDSDDSAVSASAAVKSAPAAGVGNLVDVSA